MTRPPRQLLDDGCYHLIARGNNRQFLFSNEDAFRYFLGLLARAKTRFPAKLYHDCLLSNHIHLLLEIGTSDHLPKFMQFVLQGYARWFCTQQRYSGHVWQGRYKSPLVSQGSGPRRSHTAPGRRSSRKPDGAWKNSFAHMAATCGGHGLTPSDWSQSFAGQSPPAE